MFYFKGNNLTTVATSPMFNTPMVIKNFLLTNKSGGNITINIELIGEGNINIVPYNLLLNDGDMVDSDHDIVMPANQQIRVTTTGSLDFYFTLANMQPDD